MPGIGTTVRQFTALTLEHTGHAVVEHRRGQRDVAGGDALGQGHHIGLETEILRTEPGTGAAEPADHLVGHQQYVVAPADAFDFRPVAAGWDVDPDRAHDRLTDKGRHGVGPQLQDLLFQPARSEQTVVVRVHLATLAKMIGWRDVLDPRNRQPALPMHPAHPAQTGPAHGGAVVAIVAADEDVLLRLPLHRPEMPHQPQDGVVGFRARIGKERMIQIARRQLRQLGSQVHGGLGGALKEAVVVRQLLHLPRCRLRKLGPPIAHVDAPQPGKRIQQLAAIRIPHIHPLAPRQDARALGGQCRVVIERMQMMRSIELLQRPEHRRIHDPLRT